MQKALIRAGSVLHILGVPVRLCEDAVIDASERSLALITKDRDHGTIATIAPAPTKKAAPILPQDVA